MIANRLSLFLFLCLSGFVLQGQTPFKPHLEGVDTERKSTISPEDRRLIRGIPTSVPLARQPFEASIAPYLDRDLTLSMSSSKGIEKMVVDPKTGLPIFIKGDLGLPADFSRAEHAIRSQADAYLMEIEETLGLFDAPEEFTFREMQVDELGMEHLRYDQYFRGVKIYGGEVILHRKEGKVEVFNGRYFPTPEIINTQPDLNSEEAISTALDHIEEFTEVQDLSGLSGVFGQQIEHTAELVIYHLNHDPQQERLAWSVEVQPNISNRWQYFIDAGTGEILNHFTMVCMLYQEPQEVMHPVAPVVEVETPSLKMFGSSILNGPATANATDLNGATRTINTSEVDNTFFFVDASRDMFRGGTLPNDGNGVILTADAQNESPQGDNFQPIHITSADNTWNNPVGVSAHANAGDSYEYYLQTHGRNSINGSGSDIISFINVTDENDQSMDNAFWNGFAMFYGNGNQAFTPLAGALDVVGHELTHGVIQNTANLEYQGESGALNESYADVFAVMIDREDFKLGEDVVLQQAFPSGALRDMEDPNQGGNSLNDPGYQPANTSEQFRGPQDNGGVHINSGIPNRAFFLFSEEVGKDLAERVYYRALTTYLTRTSQFIDMRAAIETSAGDLGDNSTVQAATNAFIAVGIGGGGATNEEPEDTEVNPGDNFVLFVDNNTGALELADGQGNLLTTGSDISPNTPLFKPSVTDDGTVAVYVDADKTIKAAIFDWEEGTFRTVTLSESTIWRNVAISRDGGRLAAITDDFDNLISIFDLTADPVTFQDYELSNPTTAQGGANTGDVKYSEALEWDFTGEFLMYDALNGINNLFGEIEYWDIGFLRAWDAQSNNYGDGQIFKLFSSLGEGISIGNPTFSRNSPSNIAMDLLDENTNDLLILGVDFALGTVDTIVENNTIGFPSFLSDDSGILFDFLNNGVDQILALRAISQDKTSGVGDLFLFRENAFWGTWFANGSRVLTSTEERAPLSAQMEVFPNPFKGMFQLRFESDLSGVAMVELLDLMGRRVLSEQTRVQSGANLLDFDVSEVPTGTYFLRFTVGDKVGVQQVLKVD